MKLIDSSAWIEYYRKDGSKDYKEWVFDAVQNNDAAVNCIIQLEILVFTKTQSEYNDILSDFSAFQMASEIGYDLRRRGITIPVSDLVIAASAVVFNSELIHFDKHYKYIAEYYPLKIIDTFKELNILGRSSL